MSTKDKSGARKGEPELHMGGVAGALILTVLMPTLSAYIWMCIHRNDGALWLPTSLEALHRMAAAIPRPTLRATEYLVAFVAFQVLLQLVAPGKTVLGQPLSDGTRLPYKMNGLVSLIVTLGALGALFGSGLLPWTAVYDELGGLLAVCILASVLLALFLYVYGKHSPRTERTSGVVIYDFFMGTALNPRIGNFDLKLFFESRVGMGGWAALLACLAAAEYKLHGTLSLPMMLVVGFQMFYIVDFFYFESAMLTTWDILYENYGFMLSFAFLVWMPFNFSLQAQYLIGRGSSLPWWAAVPLVIANFVGYYIFRSSNLQKHRFRTDPKTHIWGKPAEYIQTQRGTLLLTSGWWGLARHTNYLGDLTMAACWCLPCGFSHLLPYFYFIYFAPLLLNRERRDHHVCAKKYGSDWDAYCKRVPYRIFPGVY